MMNGYSYLNVLTGFVFAALMLCKLIVTIEINNAINADKTYIQIPIFVLYAKSFSHFEIA